MSADRATYVDSSAIVKLVVTEPQSAAFRRYLRRRRQLATSALARTDVVRAVLPFGSAAIARAHQVLRGLDVVRVNDRILVRAGTLRPAHLRSLDAIHLATAELLGDGLTRLCTYDERMRAAAAALGFAVVAPS